MTEPTMVTLIAPEGEGAPATTILPNGQHYTRAIDEATGLLAQTIDVWEHDVGAMKAAGFRDPAEKAEADAANEATTLSHEDTEEQAAAAGAPSVEPAEPAEPVEPAEPAEPAEQSAPVSVSERTARRGARREPEAQAEVQAPSEGS